MFPKPKPAPKKRNKKKQAAFETLPLAYCQYCGCTGAIQRHHLINRAMGGTSRQELGRDENRVDLCQDCHVKAHAYEEGYKPEDLRQAKAADDGRRRLYNELIT